MCRPRLFVSYPNNGIVLDVSSNESIICLFNFYAASTLDNQLVDILADLGETPDASLSLASSLTNGKSFCLGAFRPFLVFSVISPA